MDRPIVVPLDGTARAEGALPLALDVAGSVEAPVHLVRVSEPMPAPYAAIGDSREIIGAANLRLRQADNLYLQKVREALEEEQVAGRTVRTELLVGPARETLLAYIREQNAALVVVAPHAREGLSGILTARVSTYLIRKAPAPVLLVGEHPDDDARTRPGSFRRVVVPATEPGQAEEVARHLAIFAPNTEVIFLLPESGAVVAADGSVSTAEAEDGGEAGKPARPGLDGAESRLRAGHRVEHMDRISAASDFAELAARFQPDLIAVAVEKGRGARRILSRFRVPHPQDAQIPILVIGPGVTAVAGGIAESR